MRALPAGLQAKLDSGATTLCRCWLLTRRDGVVQGFTDHDVDIVVAGVTCRAGTGLTGSEATQKLGLAVDSSEISGALADDTLNENDLAAVATMPLPSSCGSSIGANRSCACCSRKDRSARCAGRALHSRPSCAA
jgi:hypothetical protein